MKKISYISLLLFVLSGCSSFSDGYDARLSQFSYPFKVQNFKLKTQKQDLEMAYMDLNSESKDVAVLLHGKNFSGFYWERIANDLVKKGYRVVIPDQIGFGKSSKPKFYQYSFTQLALNTKKLLDHLGINLYTVVAHSMGGMLAITMSDSFKESIKKVVLINPIGLEDYSKYVKYKDPAFFFNIERNKTAEKIRSYQKKFYYDGKWSLAYEKLVIPFARQIEGPDWERVAWNNALTYGPIFTENIIDKLKRSEVPIRMILGTRDRTGPGRNWKKDGVKHLLGQYHLMKKRLERYNKNIRVVNLKGLGHLPHFEDYKTFSKHFNKFL